MSQARQGGGHRHRLTSPQKLGFGIRHGLDHVLSVAGVEEKLTTLGIRDELNKIGITANRKQEVKFIDSKHPSHIGKSNWCVVLKFERVGKFVRWGRCRALGRKFVLFLGHKILWR